VYNKYTYVLTEKLYDIAFKKYKVHILPYMVVYYYGYTFGTMCPNNTHILYTYIGYILLFNVPEQICILLQSHITRDHYR